MRRRIALLVAVALGLGAVLVAALPFTGSRSFEGPVWDDKPIPSLAAIEGSCRPPIVSAWRKPGPDDRLELWAVTVGTGAQGYEVRKSLGLVCAESARRRLLYSLGLAVVAVAMGIFGRRRRLAKGAEPAPD